LSRTDLERFVADIKTNKDLQTAVAKGAGGLQSALAVAKANGYTISLDEARTYMRGQMSNLSDKQLDVLAGGKAGGIPFNTPVLKKGAVPPGGSAPQTSALNVQTVQNVTTVGNAVEIELFEAVGAGTSVFVVAEGVIVAS